MFKLKKSRLILLIALSSSSVLADPSSYTHISGAKVVDINSPNASGLSHNIYKEFNVTEKGLVLNNSSTDRNANVGRIAKNDNLANGAASVILNEVISNKTSSLKGFIEVAGQKADVIIANPNGITCSGCSFINAGNTTLTTGTPQLNENGFLTGYNIRGGALTIEGKGLQQENYATLLAKSIKINGHIQAKGVQARAGKFDINHQTGEVISYNSGFDLADLFFPEYSIDVSSLGGIKANSIELIGNAAGIGVRNAGNLVGQNISILSNNKLVNDGKIDGQQRVTLQGFKDVENTGTLTSAGTLNGISIRGKIQNTGTITAGQSATLQVVNGNINNQGEITAPTLVIAAVDENLKTTTAAGTITNGGQINTTKGQFFAKSFEQAGNLEAADTAMIMANDVNNSGFIKGAQVWITTSNLVNANKATIAASQLLNVDARGDLKNTGLLQSSDRMALNVAGKLENTGECVMWFCKSGTIEARTMRINAPYTKRAQDIGGNVIFTKMVFNKAE
ncbi:filamentous hemagglutinin N-terminal domain-containing protein [Cedecea colo]|uniref:Filamentous hemagglutinin N-terminal domain-containing protein n=1 Tax=Cedecea colo TaxID=2552946 RepID=A0ABX0VHK8_9ENTR|nr:filamentous hemagglutinin N-terminal domain-containing protein [Cedecea colo]NIY46563.1 filamentous hemagglutinin N-terminal domain-containing protein [Cedecea colo]